MASAPGTHVPGSPGNEGTIVPGARALGAQGREQNTQRCHDDGHMSHLCVRLTRAMLEKAEVEATFVVAQFLM
eukprot:50523-Rhodomonas_salina.1